MTLVEAKEKIAINSKFQSVRCVDYWLKQGFTIEEAKNKISKIQRTCSQRCQEHWLKQGVTIDEANLKVSELQVKNYQLKLKKYSKEEIAASSSFSPKFWEKRGLTETEAKHLCKEKSDNQSLKAFTKVFGRKIGTKKYNELCSYRKVKYTLAGYIENHGEIEGEELWSKKFVFRPNSKVATKFFNKISKLLPDEIKIYNGSNANKRNFW